MSFWDLSAAQRDDLLLRLKHRVAHLELGLPTPKELWLESLAQEFSLTKADMKAVEKGFETWSQESTSTSATTNTKD